MAKESVTEIKPPYVTYSTFSNLINGFREGVLPSRIDRSVMPGTANGVQTYLLAALRFFKLINEQGVPTAEFKALIDATDAERKAVWKGIVENGYNFIFQSDLDLQRATESQLHEKFRERGLDGATLRKCHTFFTSAVEAAGIALGPHAKSSTKGSGGVTRSAPRRKKRTDASPLKGGAIQEPPTPPHAKKMNELLLEKFPPFDPTWSSDIQAKWFEGFEKLMKSTEADL